MSAKPARGGDYGSAGPDAASTVDSALRVVVPYTDTPPAAVWQALDATGWEYEPIHVGGSDRAYFDTLSALWADGRSFAIVEHDICPHPTALDELAACPNDWCGFPHNMGDYWGEQYGLGCAKFSAALIARNPDAMIRVGVLSDDKHPKRHWCRLDAWLQGVILPQQGEQRCKHTPAVRHLGAGCSHGCVPH